MSAADLAKQFGGSELGNSLPTSNQSVQQPGSISTPQQNTPTSTANLAANYGGNELSSQDGGTTIGGIGKAIGNFFTGNTQQFGQTAGNAFAAPGNADKYAEAMQNFTDVNNSLLKAIKAKQASGGDITRLQEALHQHMQEAPKLTDFTGDVVNKTPEQVLGEAGGTALEALSGGALGGFGEAAGATTTAGKIGKAALTGAEYRGIGAATNAMQNNESLGNTAVDTLKGAAIGGATGGAVSGIGQAIDAALTKLPNRLVRSAIPALDEKGVQYALDTKPIGTVSKLYNDSAKAVKSLNSQVDAILEHPEYADVKIGQGGTKEIGGKMINTPGVVQGTLDQFPQSNYTEKDIVKAVKGLVPEKSKLIDKILSGEATLAESNDVKKAIYPKVQKVFTDLSNPSISAQKQIGAAFSTTIADNIKSYAKETEPIFENLSKEINFRNAILKTYKKEDAQKLIGLYDLANIGGGHALGGAPGAAVMEAGSKLARNPAVKFGLAKILNAIGETKGIPSVINKLNSKI